MNSKARYATGIEEVIIRLNETLHLGKSTEEAKTFLDKELFTNKSYYIEPEACLLPPRQFVFDLLDHHGIQETAHQILRQHYNNIAFQAKMKQLGL
jgi:hypothetical protein